MKHVVLINHSWIFPTLQKRWELELCFFFKNGGGSIHFSPKKGEIGKIVEIWRLLMENNLCLLANLYVYKSKKHYNPGYIYYIKVTSFIIYPCFWDKVLCNTIYIYIYIYIYIHLLGHFLFYFRNRHIWNVSPWCPLLITDHRPHIWKKGISNSF